MGRYRFSAKAEIDLENILDYTQVNWGRNQTAHYLDGLEELAQNLANNPELGIDRDSVAKELRSFPYKSHVIFYVKEKDGITIIRLLHKAMLPEKYL